MKLRLQREKFLAVHLPSTLICCCEAPTPKKNNNNKTTQNKEETKINNFVNFKIKKRIMVSTHKVRLFASILSTINIITSRLGR